MRARDNPFRTERIHRIRYEPQGISWVELWDRIVAMSFRGALVGPEGSGKTTLLEDLSPRLIAAGFGTRSLRLNWENPRFSSDQIDQLLAADLSNDVILFDGAEQLGRLAWRRFVANTLRARGLIITSHGPGLLPTILDCHTSPALFQTIVSRLLEENESIAPDEVRDLWQKHHGNIREALRELYDRYSLVPL